MAVPKLRFKADDGSEYPDWEEKTIGEIATKVDRRANEGSIAPIMMISQGNGFIFQSKKYSRENSGQSLKKYTLLQNGEMAYNHGASKACPYGVTYPLVEVSEARVPFVYHCFSLASEENQGFWKFALNSSNVNRQLKKLVSSSVRDDGLLNISFGAYMDIKVWHPVSLEQEKIADCLVTLDKVITNCQSEVDTWGKYKRGVMQQLFNQKVRFKADDGSEYPEWGKRALEECCNTFTDGNWIESKDQSDFGIRLIQTGNIGITNYLDKPDTKKWISNETFNRLHCIEVFPGDILISRLPDPAGRACIIPDLGTRMITAVDCTIVRTSDKCNSNFLVQYLSTSQYFNSVNSFLAGGTRQRISRSNLATITIPYPCLEEQQKIADCLSAFDEVIDKAKQKLEAYKQLKKGLLQQMFV